MNKKLFLGMFAAAGMLLATSCSNDELDVVQSGNEAQVTFSLGLEGGIATRAISDGTGADVLMYAVFDKDGKRINTSYNVSNHVTVKINNLDNVGKVVDAAVSAGANDINNLSFQNDVSQQLSDSLTTEAIQNGRHKAEVIAAALGRTLGPVKTVSISTTETSTMDSGYYRNPVMLKSALETATPVEKGSLIVSQDANITYYLQ